MAVAHRMRSFLSRVLRNPISGIGIALTTASAFTFLFLVAIETLGLLKSPYAGIIVFLMVPAFFTLGLVLMPIGAWWERRRKRGGIETPAWPTLDLGDPALRRMLVFISVATAVNLGILSMASYGAVEYSESRQFCGQVCHAVMEPESVSHQNGAHSRVLCVACHVGPGAGGFVAAKMKGASRLALVVSGAHSRPIQIHGENLPDVATSCEQCHWPDRFVGDRVRIFYEHADDEANTQSRTTVRIHVGGPVSGTSVGAGIHWHMNRANVVEYVAVDDTRNEIPYVRVETPDGNIREYFAKGVTEANLTDKPRRRMDCLDCHSRPAHPFGSTPERAVDAALGEGLISTKVPFIRREAVRALRAEYPTRDVALTRIDQVIREAVGTRQSQTFEEADLRQAVAVTQAIYRSSVFPSMKVGWGTYATQLGHTISTGCFRCHDEEHVARDGRTISQDCELCHTIE